MKNWQKAAIIILVPTVIVGGYMGIQWYINRNLPKKSDFDRFLSALNKKDDWSLTPDEYDSAFKKFQNVFKGKSQYNYDQIMALIEKEESEWVGAEKRLMQLFMTDVFANMSIRGMNYGASEKDVDGDEKIQVVKQYKTAMEIIQPYSLISKEKKIIAQNLLTKLNSKYIIKDNGSNNYSVKLRA